MTRNSADQTAIAAAGYAAVREAFNRALDACARKLTPADIAMAQDVLEIEEMDEQSEIFLMDTALFSRPGGPFVRSGARRPIDRIAPKIPAKRDPLMGAIARKLPEAFFSVFEVESRHSEGGILAKDLLDDGRVLHIMDEAIAASTRPGVLFAGRFVDLGPWLAGFGVAVALRKSEAAAILIALSHGGSLSEKRDTLHELVYLGRIHDADLVLPALEPIISTMAFVIDETDIEIGEIVAKFRSAMELPA